MKICNALLFFFLAHTCMAQKPQPVLSFATQLQSVQWYDEQSILWKNEIDKNTQNSYAWYNYYRALRNKLRLDTTDKRTHQEKIVQLKAIIDNMAKAVPNSFDYNLSKWMFEGNNFDSIKYLKKAEELGENRTEHYSDMLGWGEISRDISKRDKYAKRWLERAPYSPGLMYYNYNVLAGLKPNAILLTVGDNDTYPCWLLQAQGIRRDVHVVNASLIYIDVYRKALFTELGISELKNMEDLNRHPSANNHNQWFKTELIRHMAKNTGKFPVNVALTCSEEYTKSIADSLYLTGLTYEYSIVDPDNIALMVNNFEHVYALDYLDKPFYNDISNYYTQLINFNYIVPMMRLFEHYQLCGDKEHAALVKDKIMKIAKGRKEETEIRNCLNNASKRD